MFRLYGIGESKEYAQDVLQELKNANVKAELRREKRRGSRAVLYAVYVDKTRKQDD